MLLMAIVLEVVERWELQCVYHLIILSFHYVSHVLLSFRYHLHSHYNKLMMLTLPVLRPVHVMVFVMLLLMVPVSSLAMLVWIMVWF